MHAYTYIYICIHTCVMCMCVSLSLSLYIYIYIYIYTYIYISTRGHERGGAAPQRRAEGRLHRLLQGPESNNSYYIISSK